MSPSGNGLTILEALENLNVLAEARSLDELEVTEKAQIVSHRDQEVSEIQWVKASQDDYTKDAIKATFHTVLRYLKENAKRLEKEENREKLEEGFSNILSLVGQAADNLEKISGGLKEKVIEEEEFKDFYRKNIQHIKKEPQKIASVAQRALSEKNLVWKIHEGIEALKTQEFEGEPLLNDLEVVKKDHLYELFYLKSAAGHPFYTYGLAKKLKLEKDFGIEAFEEDDPFIHVKNWEDKSLHLLANELLDFVKPYAQRFYKEAFKYKENHLVATVHNCFMALKLAANPRNLLRQFSLKGCDQYFHDFQLFLREALLDRDYQKFTVYSPPASQPFFVNLVDWIQKMCEGLFVIGADLSELKGILGQYVPSFDQKLPLFEQFLKAGSILEKRLKKHPSGPIMKAVDQLQDLSEQIYDPLLLKNLPTFEAEIEFQSHSLKVMRIPCPTVQEFVHHAYISEEYKTYLTSIASDKKKSQLLVNFQDRTSWREHARGSVLEDTSRQAQFSEILTVVTLSKDTDFYNQQGDYAVIDNSQEFKKQIKSHFEDETTGYFFPKKLKEHLFHQFIDQMLEKIHEMFFHSKERLSVKERLDFIEIAYQLLILKIAESIQPNLLSLVSKDGLDISGSATSEFLLFLLLGQNAKITEKDYEALLTILFAPTLLIRERIIHPERFERFVEMVRVMEKRKGFFTELKSLYHAETLKVKVRFH